MPFTVRWADGGSDTAPSATALLERIASQQMNPEDRANVKAALAWRAQQMFDAKLDVTLEDEQFLRAAAMMGMFQLSDGPDA
jgi:hypothetical protein